MDLLLRWAWPAFLTIMWGLCAWRLIEAARTGRATLARGWSFARRSEPFEFWFLNALNLIVLVGVLWMAIEGW